MLILGSNMAHSLIETWPLHAQWVSSIAGVSEDEGDEDHSLSTPTHGTGGTGRTPQKLGHPPSFFHPSVGSSIGDHPTANNS